MVKSPATGHIPGALHPRFAAVRVFDGHQGRDVLRVKVRVLFKRSVDSYAGIDAVKLACGRMVPKKKAIEAISGTSFAGLVTDWYPDNRIHECPPSDERANIRSATPLGFARAVFLSNAPHLNKKREAA